MDGKVLVTGGAGYIGSHVVKQLVENGRDVVVIDNLSTGFESSLLGAELVLGDVADRRLVSSVLSAHNVRTIMHFAAHTVVPESVEDPIKYYNNNTAGTCNLLRCAQAHSVEHFVFSSTAAVYGVPSNGVCREDSATSPINPYGWSKWMSEQMLRDVATASSLRYVILRYFNVAGSDSSGQIGQSTKKATLLTKVACEAAVGVRDRVRVFGTDYPTPDGTGVRDYIHVEDLASAHLAALEYLEVGGGSETLNCGYGHGYSVREVLTAVEKVAGKSLRIEETSRRAGDPPVLIADVDRIANVLDWQPKHDDLESIADTSLRWERKLAETRAVRE